MATDSIRDLYQRLIEDEFRRANDFSEDLRLAHSALFHPYATDADREKVLGLWLQDNQPCLFGRIGAGQKTLHYCILTDEDLQASDEDIAKQIREEIAAWKRRSVRPAPEISQPAHGFVLAIISQRVALAEPNDTLRLFVERLLELWGCEATEEDEVRIYWERLFLEKPDSEELYSFVISMDFFAAQGDRRWWHDHRVPGGIAFTANSAGHMRRYREWYEGKTDQTEWLLATAMGTIDLAAETSFGRATWLRDVPPDGKPLVPKIPCPFSNLEEVKEKIRGKDWTRYAGHYHTDQAVRPPLFQRAAEKSAAVLAREWLLDFTYLYNRDATDHLRLIEGERVSREEVAAVIGDPDTWSQITSPRRRRRIRATVQRDRRELDGLIGRCERWALSPEALRKLMRG